MQAKKLAFFLVLNVLGLYASFISWSVLQERINTKPYYKSDYEFEYFKAPLIINIIQAFFASLIGYCYSRISSGSSPLAIFTENERNIALKYLNYFILIAITSSIASPIGYESFKHVDYLVYLLAKSCKLIPVMLVHLIMYRTKFPKYKYFVAIMVTLGVSIFTLAHSSSKKASNNDGKTLLGILQLIFSMILDGLTNSTQDQMFKLQSTSNPKGKSQKMTGSALMSVLNFFIFVLSSLYVLFFKYESDFTYSTSFFKKYPRAMFDVFAFALFGAIGQVFVFIILERYGSIILITATVTRKMLSMILSVVLFGHNLNGLQWIGVLMVFGGIGYEAMIKLQKAPVSKDKKNN